MTISKLASEIEAALRILNPGRQALDKGPEHALVLDHPVEPPKMTSSLAIVAARKR
jgi:hypothetical protein